MLSARTRSALRTVTFSPSADFTVTGSFGFGSGPIGVTSRVTFTVDGPQVAAGSATVFPDAAVLARNRSTAAPPGR